MPWSDERDAREFLGWLADSLVGAMRSPPEIDARAQLATWLDGHELAAPAYATIGRTDAELADLLRPAALSTAAWNGAQFDALDRIDRALGTEGIRVVLLKGAALAHAAWGGPGRRPMSDLDLWVGPARVDDAVRVLHGLGYGEPRRSGDEIQLRPVGWPRGLVELHETAFRGAWVGWTASVDEGEAWHRAGRLDPPRHALRLAAEDEILHLACHLVANHVAQAPLRGLLDIALVARTRKPDWAALVERASRWRIATATWLALDRTERTFGLPGAEATIARLAPSLSRSLALRRVATPGAILARRIGRPTRNVIPLVCTDRARDILRLARRAAWPDRPWIVARYGAGAGRATHLRALLGAGRS